MNGSSWMSCTPGKSTFMWWKFSCARYPATGRFGCPIFAALFKIRVNNSRKASCGLLEILERKPGFAAASMKKRLLLFVMKKLLLLFFCCLQTTHRLLLLSHLLRWMQLLGLPEQSLIGSSVNHVTEGPRDECWRGCLMLCGLSTIEFLEQSWAGHEDVRR